MFTLPRRSRFTRRIFPTTHFAHCISRAKTTARGFWAWIPEVPLELPRVELRVQAPAAAAEDGAGSYCEAIVAAAARVHSPT
jgi:hypothetical protein